MILRALGGPHRTVLLHGCRVGTVAARPDLNLVRKRWEHVSTPVATNTSTVLTTDNNIVPPNIKWDTDALTAHLVVKPEITGAILPWIEMNIVQKLFFPYTYSIMYYLDYMITVMPWWSSIMALNFALKLVFLPVTIKHTKVSVRVHNLTPETQAIQVKLNEAMTAGNNYEIAVQKTKLKMFFEEKDIKIRDRVWPILIQAPGFFSSFFLLRKLSEFQVPGLVTGGALWFTNLSLPDPYYILPLVTCLSNFLLLEYGMPTKPATMTPAMRWFMRGFSVVLFPIIYHFPTSVVIFWTTNNILTLATNLCLKQSEVRKKLGIPVAKVFDISQLPLSRQTFKGQMREAMEKSRVTKATNDIRRLDDVAFRKAGVGPLRKTYKEPPK